MKKFLAKLVLFAIVSMFIASTTVNAIDPDALENIQALLQKAQENPCIKLIKDDGSLGPDEGYIVTFIEEPLDATPKGDPGDEFIQRICYRHTLQYQIIEDGKVRMEGTLSELSNSEQTCYSGLTKEEGGIKTTYSCKQIQALLSKGGTSLIYGYIGMIYRWGASIVGIIAVLVIVLSGIQISAAGGDPEAINTAKKRIIQSIAGIVVLFLSGLILYTINPTFFTK